MPAKGFLLRECKNVREVLEETLRFKYGLEGSKHFFEECDARLNFITNELEGTDPADHYRLRINGRLLNTLSDLISRIERSSLGEYSWPFVEGLKDIAKPICTEATVTDPVTPPLFHVLSGGGLSSYAIYAELNRVASSKNRILNIVFPRTLKHFVLLHSILGHEIGHAIWRSVRHQSKLKNIMASELFQGGGPFSNRISTAEWIYSNSAPTEVKDVLAQLVVTDRRYKHLSKNNFFDIFASWEAWKEEILCDFIGLLTFGPSFVAAHCELLYAIVPSGIDIGPLHPPVGFRVNLMLTAAKFLGYETMPKLPKGELSDALKKFWAGLNKKRQTNSWFDIFSEKQIRNVLN